MYVKLIIQSYLSRHYEIQTSEVGNDGIYDKHDTRRHKGPIYGTHLTKDLTTIFGVAEDELIVCINDWALSVKPDVDLEFYWKTLESLFPIAKRVAAQTVGLDLVSVQPMKAPTGLLFYLDYVHAGATPPIRPERQAMIDELARNQRRYLDYTPEEIARQSWFGTLDENDEN